MNPRNNISWAAKALCFVLLALPVYGQAQNMQAPKSVPALGGGSVGVSCDGTGYVYLSLPTAQSLTLDYSDIANLKGYLDQFQVFARAVAAGNDAKVDYPLGVQSLVPYMPGISKLWMQAYSNGKDVAMGMRLVCYSNHGGWGGDSTVWLDVNSAGSLGQLLLDAVQTDGALQSNLKKLWKAAGHD
jgi:hypothetical protein